MKWLGYIGIVNDLLLGNGHYIYYSSTAEEEWYVSDICQATRIAIWIFIALFWNRTLRSENWTVGWYGVCALWDVLQTINNDNGTNPTPEILIFLAGAGIIQLYFKTYGNHKTQDAGSHKK